jgi:hypothetical protein
MEKSRCFQPMLNSTPCSIFSGIAYAKDIQRHVTINVAWALIKTRLPSTSLKGFLQFQFVYAVPKCASAFSDNAYKCGVWLDFFAAGSYLLSRRQFRRCASCVFVCVTCSESDSWPSSSV